MFVVIIMNIKSGVDLLVYVSHCAVAKIYLGTKSDVGDQEKKVVKHPRSTSYFTIR